MKYEFDLQSEDGQTYLEVARRADETNEYIRRYADYLNKLVKYKTAVLIDELVEERKKQGLTQQKIAERTGVAASNIARFELKRSTPTFQFLEKYAAGLGKEIVYELKDR